MTYTFDNSKNLKQLTTAYKRQSKKIKAKHRSEFDKIHNDRIDELNSSELGIRDNEIYKSMQVRKKDIIAKYTNPTSHIDEINAQLVELDKELYELRGPMRDLIEKLDIKYHTIAESINDKFDTEYKSLYKEYEEHWEVLKMVKVLQEQF